MMFFDYATTDRESQTRTLAFGFRGKEWVPDLFQICRGNAGTVISDQVSGSCHVARASSTRQGPPADTDFATPAICSFFIKGLRSGCLAIEHRRAPNSVL